MNCIIMKEIGVRGSLKLHVHYRISVIFFKLVSLTVFAMKMNVSAFKFRLNATTSKKLSVT